MTGTVAEATKQLKPKMWMCQCGEGILGEIEGKDIIIKSQGCTGRITDPKQIHRLCPKCGRYEPLIK